MAALHITPIPAFSDNYIWALYIPAATDTSQAQAVIVDPGDAAPVLQWLADKQVTLTGILITHHHADHTRGLPALLQHYPDIPVYGPAEGHIPLITSAVRDGDILEIFGRRVDVMAVPGHTLDHLAYLFEEGSFEEKSFEERSFEAKSFEEESFAEGSLVDRPTPQNNADQHYADQHYEGTAAGAPLLFCGDTLFAAGCGKIFEGTADMMYTSLHRLASLPASTRVYCAHEYTLNNLRFAMNAEPDNMALRDRITREQQRRDLGIPTVPSTILSEQRTNPFLRCHSDCLRQAVTSWAATQSLDPPSNDRETFALLRRWKDQS